MKAILNYIKYRIWAAQQYPDPELIYKWGGLHEVVGYLKSCSATGKTNEILTRFGADIHPDACPMGPWLTIHEAVGDFSNLSVAAHGYIGKEVFLDLSDKIIIEDSAGVGMRSILLTHRILGDFPNKRTNKIFKNEKKPIILRKGCSVGAGAIILCGVEIGEDAVINAGVLVDRDVPPRTVVFSSRVKDDYVIRERFLK